MRLANTLTNAALAVALTLAAPRMAAPQQIASQQMTSGQLTSALNQPGAFSSAGLADPSTFVADQTQSLGSNVTGAILDHATFGASCQKLCIRKEIHDLTTAELDAYLNAIKALMKRPSPTMPGYSIFEAWVVLHKGMYDHCHGGAPFLPWHRGFILDFERELQKVNPTICLPYWDQSREAADPFNSIVFTKYYGAYSAANNGECLDHGVFANTTFVNSTVSDKGCLYRSMRAPQNATLIDSHIYNQLVNDSAQLTGADAFQYYAKKLEYYHGGLHTIVGGCMYFAFSPSDPLFYLHHAFVDKTWSDAQLVFAEQNLVQFAGTDKAGNTVHDTDTLSPFGLTVRQVLDTKNLCYLYAAPGEGRTYNTQYQRTLDGVHYVAVPLDRSSGFVGQSLEIAAPITEAPDLPPPEWIQSEFSLVASSNATSIILKNGTVVPNNNVTQKLFLGAVHTAMDNSTLENALNNALNNTPAPDVSSTTLQDRLNRISQTIGANLAPSPTNGASRAIPALGVLALGVLGGFLLL